MKGATMFRQVQLSLSLVVALSCPASVQAGFLTAFRDPAGNRPTSTPPLSWSVAEPLQRPFTSLYPGRLLRIELHGLSGDAYSPTLGLFDDAGELLATSQPAAVPGEGWMPFVFRGFPMQPGRNYEFRLQMPDDGSITTDIDWNYYLDQGDRAGAIAFQVWLDSFDTMPGDINGDSAVDLSDFGLLKANFGETKLAGPADLNGDGTVNLTDYGILKENFGKSAAAAVPEASSATLAFLALAAVAMGRRALVRSRR